jgi:hypothetical protein
MFGITNQYQSLLGLTPGNYDTFQLRNGASTGYILECADSSGSAQWTDPTSLPVVTSATGTANMVSVNGSYSVAQTGPCTFALPQAIATTSSPIFAALTVSTFKMSTGASNGYFMVSDAVGNGTWQALTGIVTSVTGTPNRVSVNGSYTVAQTGAITLSGPQDLNVTSSPTFTNVTASLTGHASLDLALTGGTMAGSILMNSNNLTGANSITGTFMTITSTASLGSLTMLSAGINMAGFNITGAGIIQGTTLQGTLGASSASQPNITTLAGVNSINTVGNTVTICGAALTSTILNSYLATMDQALSTTSNPTFGTVTAAVTGHASLDLALTGGTLTGTLSMGSNNISGIATASGSTASFTTLTGTLSTASQPNITSLGSLTGLRVNGLVGINQAGSIPYYFGITIDNTNYGGLSISGTSTDVTAASHYGAYIGPGYKPTNTNSNYYTCLQLSPVFASSASQTLSGPCTSLYISDFFTGNAGTISGAYGILYDGGGPLGGSITNHYGGYFNIPAAGTNKFALFAGNIAVGSSVVPPTNGIYSLGSVLVGAGSTSVNGLAYNADNTIGLNFATGTMNLCASGTNQLVVSNGSVAVSNGTTLSTSQTAITGDAAHLLMRASNTNRWGIGMKGTESSGNAGSNFVIFNYTDAASFLSDALVITRSNNKFTISGPVSLTSYTDDTNGNLTSGSYRPTIANVSNVNVANSTTGPHFYQRIGDRVHIDGYCTIGSSGAGLTTFTFTITLPFSQGNFSGTADAVGQGVVYEITSATNRSTCNVGSTNAAQTLNISVTTFSTAPATTANIIFVGYSVTYRVR